jgi:hypothetical protein
VLTRGSRFSAPQCKKTAIVNASRLRQPQALYVIL